jgi:hypothetical protein
MTPSEDRARFEAALALILDVPWYATINDLIGGWSVSNVDKPASLRDHREGDVAVADFMEKRCARHIVSLHNASLANKSQP